MKKELLGFRDLADAVWHEPGIRVIVTTNLGWSRKEKRAYMGAGSAKRANDLSLGLDRRYCAALMRGEGSLWLDGPTPFGCLAVKPARVCVNASKDNIVSHMRSRVSPGAAVAGWMSVASPSMIRGGLRMLTSMAEGNPGQSYLLAMPGMGNGQLDPKVFAAEVGPTLDALPDNVDVFYQNSDPRSWIAYDHGPEELYASDDDRLFCDSCRAEAGVEDMAPWVPVASGWCSRCGGYVFHEEIRSLLP